MKTSAAVVLASTAYALAGPLKQSITTRDDGSVTSLAQTDIDSWNPYLYFVAAVYCDSNELATWACGANCDKNKFEVVAAGGDGSDIQNWYVGYAPDLGEIIIAHQGTDLTHFEAILTDTKLIQKNLPSDIFPGVPSGAMVHEGFLEEYQKTNDDVYSALETALSQYNATKVTFTGHSLGAGLTLLESLSITTRMSNRGLTFKTRMMGLSRCGNPTFADWVDATLTDVHFVQNQNDLVPIIPFISMGYKGINGEVHITDNETWNNCPGQDTEAEGCALVETPSLLSANFLKHFGPYNGIGLGFCSMNSS